MILLMEELFYNQMLKFTIRISSSSSRNETYSRNMLELSSPSAMAQFVIDSGQKSNWSDVNYLKTSKTVFLVNVSASEIPGKYILLFQSLCIEVKKSVHVNLWED